MSQLREMLSQYGIKLAVHIITTDFGNLVAQVCDCLLRRGRLPKLGIASHTEIPVDNVTKCLQVLIQHNCAEKSDFGESEKISTQYMAVFNNIICRLRYPKFLIVVSKELDEECSFVLEGLLQHGRLTLSQILDRATDFSDGGEILRERFMKLVEARYIERCPAAECCPAAEHCPATKHFPATESCPAAEGCPAAVCCPTWRVNFDEFKSLFHKKACVERTKTRLDNEAGVVLMAILDATKATGNTASFSIHSIFEEVNKSEEGPAMTLEHIRAFLVQLGCDSVGPDGSYTIDLTEIIKRAQREEVESVVLKRYGKEAYKLFRLLAESRHPCETSKISGNALVEHKDAKKILYKMWMDNYLHMEVVKCSRQVDLFFWSVNKNLIDQILDELFHAALNLRIRISYETDCGREVMLQGKQKTDVKERSEKLKAVKRLLDSSLAKLDDSIMLFNDF